MLESTHAGESQDYTRPKDMAEASGAKNGTPTKATKHIGGRGCWANTGIFNGQFTEGDRHNIAKDHYHSDSGTPFQGIGNHCK